VHPWLHQHRTVAGNRWRQWLRRQPEGSVHLAALVVVAVVLWRPIGLAADRLGDQVGAYAALYPWLVGLVFVALTGLASSGRLRRVWMSIYCGLWCPQPQAARHRFRAWWSILLVTSSCSALICAVVGLAIYGTYSLHAVWLGALGGGVGPILAGSLVGSWSGLAAVQHHRPAMPRWPDRASFSDGLGRWQRLRVSSRWRSSALSSGGLLAVGLLIPAGSGVRAMVAGVLALILCVRLIVLMTSAADLVFGASQLLAAQPLSSGHWYRAHAKACMPEGLVLTLLIACCVHFLSAPAAFVLGTCLLLIWVLLIDLEWVRRYRLRPRRRTIAWGVIAASAVALGAQAAPLMPLLMLAGLIALRLSRGKHG